MQETRRHIVELEERGFLPELKRGDNTYVLRKHNCPVLRLAPDHPEVCDGVHRGMQSLAGVPLIRVRCMRRGVAFSEYHFRRSKSGWLAGSSGHADWWSLRCRVALSENL